MTTAMAAKTATLYYRNGSSDKEYRVWIEAKEDGFVVNFAYGRRGSTLTTGTKTKNPVTEAAAVTLFDKLVSEKTSKGYTPGEDGTPYQHSDKAKQVSGLLPQLLTVLDEREVGAIVDDPAWCMQEKFDGRRLMLRKIGESVEGINKLGLLVGLPEPVAAAARALSGDFTLDGEVIGDCLWAFDCLQFGDDDLRPRSYRDRYAALTELLSSSGPNISLVDCWDDALDKAEKLSSFKASGAEGVVFKRWDAPYAAGRPNSGGPQRKHKFVATLSAVVTEVNQKRSVVVSLLGDTGLQSVGNVTIPANHPVPQTGSVVEVRYLYAAVGGSLFQPVYLGERSDVEAHECVTAQLKYKAS